MRYAKKGTQKSQALSVLRMITKMISVLSEEDLEALASGRAQLTIIRSKDSQVQMSLGHHGDTVFDLNQLKSELSLLESTDAGFSVLSKAGLGRVELERLARSLDLPVLKQDSVRRLEEKIVEALVGSRLNSRAVRGR